MSSTATETVALAVNQTGALADAGKNVLGGNYALICSGTLGATPTLQIKNPNGDWVSYTTAIAPGWANIPLPAGVVRINLAAGAAAAYVYASRIPD